MANQTNKIRVIFCQRLGAVEVLQPTPTKSTISIKLAGEAKEATATKPKVLEP